MSNRRADLKSFYDIICELEHRLGGKRTLAGCTGRMDWPKLGVYFFFEEGEKRSDSGLGERVVRVGTHGLHKGAKSTLWGRLAQHRGRPSGGGNHRCSIFRGIIGEALTQRDAMPAVDSWRIKGDAGKAARRLGMTRDALIAEEQPIENAVSQYIHRMPFLWLSIDDEPGPNSERGVIERNAISLLSNFAKESLDASSKQWLGRHCRSKYVTDSGLWNSNHVNEVYEPSFLVVLNKRVRSTITSACVP